MRNITDYRRALLVFAAFGLAVIPACDEKDNPLSAAGEELAEQCGLTCPVEGVLEGNASISGVAKVDAFFKSVVNFQAKADLTASRIDAELAKIRTSLDLDANAGGAEIVAAIKAKYQLEGSLAVRVQPARCAVSAEATVQAQARCEGEVTPPMASVECKGSCEVEASGSVECEGELECTGTAPELKCEGSCQGSCELTVAAECAGTCHGECDGTCSSENSMGQCNGTCEGQCQGSCELTAGGECSGECRGQCTYKPATAECNGTARCQAMGSASVECKGKCEGEFTPPQASVECEASAKAEASLEVECTPPSIDIGYQFSASADAQTKAEFQAFLVGFRARASAIVAELKRAEVVIAAGAEVAASAETAVSGAINVALEGETSLKAKIGLGCALGAIPDVATAVSASTQRLQTRVTAAADLSTALTKG